MSIDHAKKEKGNLLPGGEYDTYIIARNLSPAVTGNIQKMKNRTEEAKWQTGMKKKQRNWFLTNWKKPAAAKASTARSGARSAPNAGQF